MKFFMLKKIMDLLLIIIELEYQKNQILMNVYLHQIMME